MLFEKMRVRFGNSSGQTHDLIYQIRKTKAAQIWAQCVHRCAHQKLQDDDQFHNIPGQTHFELANLIEKLKKLISQLKNLHPELPFPEIDTKDLQKSVNELHYNFAHSHHVMQLINESNKKAWLDFNLILHAIEAAFTNEKTMQYTGLPNARVVFTWGNAEDRVPLPEESYQDFHIGYEFGTAYANYSQVGRHFYEMFLAQDDHLHKTHIQPWRYISADTSLWFGPRTSHAWAASQLNQMRQWFEKRKTFFNSLGYHWGDPKLAIGRLPVARLEEPLYTHNEILAFLNHLSNFTYVQKVEVYGS